MMQHPMWIYFIEKNAMSGKDIKNQNWILLQKTHYFHSTWCCEKSTTVFKLIGMALIQGDVIHGDLVIIKGDGFISNLQVLKAVLHRHTENNRCSCFILCIDSINPDKYYFSLVIG